MSENATLFQPTHPSYEFMFGGHKKDAHPTWLSQRKDSMGAFRLIQGRKRLKTKRGGVIDIPCQSQVRIQYSFYKAVFYDQIALNCYSRQTFTYHAPG